MSNENPKEIDRALMYAVSANRSDMVEKLLGARKKKLLLFVEKKRPEMEKRLQKSTGCKMAKERGIDPKHYVEGCIYGHKMAYLHVQMKAYVDAQNKEGETCLMLAVKNVNISIVGLLLEWFPDVNAADNLKRTPLMSAAFFGGKDIAELLLDYKADVNAVSKHGTTPLMLAAKNGHADVVRLLFKHGVKANLINRDNQTALDLAETNGHTDVAKFLIEHGAKRGCDCK